MGQLNSVALIGKIKSAPVTLPNTPEKMFILRNRFDTLGDDGKGKRIYSRIPVIIPDSPSHATVAANLISDAEVKVHGRLVRRKMSRPDGTTYITTCILGEYFEISIRSRPMPDIPEETDEEDTADA